MNMGNWGDVNLGLKEKAEEGVSCKRGKHHMARCLNTSIIGCIFGKLPCVFNDNIVS